MEKKSLFIFVLLISLIGLIYAIPQLPFPHQFYGSIEVNGEPANNNVIVAEIGNEEYSTIINDGWYGINPNLFFVGEIDSNSGELITFYVGGMEAESFVFEKDGYTRLNFSLTTECGDSFCLGSETCSNCEEDCGICTDPPQIFIESPVDKIYNTSKIDLKVNSNQNIIMWMYSINDGTPEVFIPNIILTLATGEYELEIIGMNKEYQSNSEKVSFEIDAPKYCGDDICSPEISETCSICNVDCGPCAPPVSNGGDDNGGGGGGGFFSSLFKKIISSTEKIPEVIIETPEEEIPSEPTEETQDNVKFFPSITGAVVGFSKTNIGKVVSLVLLIIVILGVILLLVHLKNKKRTEGKSKEFIPEKTPGKPEEEAFH